MRLHEVQLHACRGILLHLLLPRNELTFSFIYRENLTTLQPITAAKPNELIAQYQKQKYNVCAMTELQRQNAEYRDMQPVERGQSH